MISSQHPFALPKVIGSRPLSKYSPVARQRCAAATAQVWAAAFVLSHVQKRVELSRWTYLPESICSAELYWDQTIEQVFACRSAAEHCGCRTCLGICICAFTCAEASRAQSMERWAQILKLSTDVASSIRSRAHTRQLTPKHHCGTSYRKAG